MEVHLRLAPGGEDKGPGVATPMMVTAPLYGQLIGRSVCSFPRSQANRSAFTKRQDFPTFQDGMIRAGAIPLLSVGPFLFQAPSTLHFATPTATPT